MNLFQKFITQIQKFTLSESDSLWLKEQRVYLQEYIKRNPIVGDGILERSVFSRPRFGFQATVAFALSFILIVGLGGGKALAYFDVSATNPLYPVKITAEKIEGLLIFSDEKKLDFVIRLAQKRMQELQETINEGGGQADSQVINKILGHYSDLMDQASRNIDAIASKGDKKVLLSVSKKLQNSKPEEVLSKVKVNKENSSALLSAEGAALTTETKAVDALKHLDEEQQAQTKTEAESQITSLHKKVSALQDLMNEIKSVKGYVVLGDAYRQLEGVQGILEEARRFYEQGKFLQASDMANDGMTEALEVKKTLVKLLDQEPEPDSDSVEK